MGRPARLLCVSARGSDGASARVSACVSGCVSGCVLACVLATALLLAMGWRSVARAGQDARPCPLVKGPTRAVVRIIDGETLVLDDGSELRLIGAMAPRAPGPWRGRGQARAWPPADAARRFLARLALGKSLTLRFDKSRRDRYGRWLAHAFVREAPEGESKAGREGEGAAIWLQGALVRAGLARAYSFKDQRACAARLLALEAEARRAKKGIWRNAAYAVRKAWRTRALLRYRQTFQIVEGRILRVATVGRRTFLNFGKRWRDDFTVLIEGRDARLWQKAGQNLAQLAGRRVRVRGWIERWNGPLMRVTHPEQIEVLDRGRKRARGSRSREH